jgi:hypothetical protein
VSNVGTSRVITHPKLPFNLATPAGAKMIGYRGDAAYKTSAFHNLEPILHEDYKRAITDAVGENPFTTTSREDGVDRTNVGVFVTMVTSIAGIDNTQRQKKARNPLPSWFFLSDNDTTINGIRALYDAEGSPTSRGLQLGQAVFVGSVTTKLQLPKPKNGIRVSRLEPDAYNEILAYPPLLLVSTSLLLYRLGMVSYMSPQEIWSTPDGCTVFWNLAAYRMRNMEIYRDKIGFLSPTKQTKLIKFTTKTSSPSPLFFWPGGRS